MLQRCLIWTHRYIGIPVSVLFVLWFASGVVMMYTGDMPRVAPAERLRRLPPLDVARLRLTPGAAAEAAGLGARPRRAALSTVVGRPAYRFDDATVFADTGEPLRSLGPDAARAVARRYAGAAGDTIEYVGFVGGPDQWTLVVRDGLPAHRFRLGDAAGTELYVARDTAEVVMATTRRQRLLAWLGAIPHWFYLPQLRVDRPLWEAVIVWTSAVGCLIAMTGLLLGVTRFRWQRPRDGRPRIPYAGWMRWHYLTGAVFGVATLTWVFSGLLSVQPFAWMTVRGLHVPPAALGGGPPVLADFPEIDPAAWARATAGRAVKEVGLLRIDGAPYYEVHLEGDTSGARHFERRLLAADTLAPRAVPPGCRHHRRPLAGNASGRRGGGRGAAGRVRRVLLRPRRRPPAAARHPRALRRPAGNLDLRRSGRLAHHGLGAPLQPPGAVAVQRTAQPRLRLLVRPPPAVGHRPDRAQPGRHRVERHRALGWRRAGEAGYLAPGAARSGRIELGQTCRSHAATVFRHGARRGRRRVVLVAAEPGRGAGRGARLQGCAHPPDCGPPIESGVLVVRGGTIVAVGGPDVAVPPGAVEHDLSGRVLLPGVVDSHSHVGSVSGGDRSSPLHPDVRGLDSIDIASDSFWRARAVG